MRESVLKNFLWFRCGIFLSLMKMGALLKFKQGSNTLIAVIKFIYRGCLATISPWQRRTANDDSLKLAAVSKAKRFLSSRRRITKGKIKIKIITRRLFAQFKID